MRPGKNLRGSCEANQYLADGYDRFVPNSARMRQRTLLEREPSTVDYPRTR
jgi:hypothetical protein